MNGTSVASPLIAGSASLLLQAFPNAKAKQVIEALRKTASFAESPNNDYGWGIADVQAAYDFLLHEMGSSDGISWVGKSGFSERSEEKGDTEVSLSELDNANSQWAKIKSELVGSWFGQNYPNPFNPDTWIPFKLSESANIEVRIYDVTGSIVRIIDVGRKPAGIYVDKDRAVYWDGRNQAGERVSSGVYFCQIIAGDLSSTKRLTVLE
jgi:hypothetical protein